MTKQPDHKPDCEINIACMVDHKGGPCLGYGNCTCGLESIPDHQQAVESTLQPVAEKCRSCGGTDFDYGKTAKRCDQCHFVDRTPPSEQSEPSSTQSPVGSSKQGEDSNMAYPHCSHCSGTGYELRPSIPPKPEGGCIHRPGTDTVCMTCEVLRKQDKEIGYCPHGKSRLSKPEGVEVLKQCEDCGNPLRKVSDECLTQTWFCEKCNSMHVIPRKTIKPEGVGEWDKEESVKKYARNISYDIDGYIEYVEFYGESFDIMMREALTSAIRAAEERKEGEWREILGKHNARILNEFQKQGKPDMPFIAHDERICLIPAIEIATKETLSELLPLPPDLSAGATANLSLSVL